MLPSFIKFDKVFLMTLEVISRSFISNVNFFILLFFLTYYSDVAIIIMLLFINVVFNLNGFTYYLHGQTKHMVDIFGMTLEAISRPFNIESLKLFQFCCFSFSYCLICILLCKYYLKCNLCYVAFKKN